MVVYASKDNKSLKIPNMNEKITSCQCGVTKMSSNLQLPTSVNKSNKTTFHIKTGSNDLQNIGLNVNTNVHFKPKKRLLDFRDFVIAILLCLLMGVVIMSYCECKYQTAKVDATRMYIEELGESLDTVSAMYALVQERLTQLEENVLPKEIKHSVTKRETAQQITGSNCTDLTRQARSLSRGPFAIHLRGALPEISVRDAGIIAPWYIDNTSSGMFQLVDGLLGEGRGIIEIIEEGLYFIYAQMYYLTSSSLNSYAINLQLAEGKGREDMVVAVCSAEAAVHKLSELSCYTAVVRYLHKGDRLYVTQRERNRRIIFRENKSFLGFVLLNSPQGFAQ